MKNIVILGNGVIAAQLPETFPVNSNDKIIIISTDKYYPYDSSLFPALINKEVSLQKIYCRPNDYYAQRSIDVVLGKRITRINPNRRKIFTEEKETFDFDVLVISNAQDCRFPDIKGTNKTGVVGLAALTDIDTIINMLPLVDTIAVEAKTFKGLEIACALSKRKKEVIVFLSKENPLVVNSSAEILTWFCEVMETKGVRCFIDNDISEILGDSHVKAVRLKSGKVLAAQMVLFDCLEYDLRVLGDDIVHEKGRVTVDENCRTNNESVYAVSPAAQTSKTKGNMIPKLLAEYQTQVVAGKLSGNSSGIAVPLFWQELMIDDLSVCTIGDLQPAEDTTSLEAFDKAKCAYVKVLLKGNNPIGAVLVNRNEDRAVMESFIKGEKSLDESALFVSSLSGRVEEASGQGG
jgi:nitrite reductase (NADH) large subunit